MKSKPGNGIFTGLIFLILYTLIVSFTSPAPASLVGTWAFTDARSQGVKSVSPQAETSVAVTSATEPVSTSKEIVAMDTYIKTALGASGFTFTDTEFEFIRSTNHSEKGTWQLEKGTLTLTYGSSGAKVIYPISFKDEKTMELETDFDGHAAILVYTKQF